MGYMSGEERQNLIQKINKSYGFRKFLMIFEMVLLIGFIVMTFLSLYYNKPWIDNKHLTDLGKGMLAWAVVMAVFGIITLILILTLKSPKTVTKEVTRLESAAISGKKNEKNSAANFRERTTIAKKPKAKKGKK